MLHLIKAILLCVALLSFSPPPSILEFLSSLSFSSHGQRVIHCKKHRNPVINVWWQQNPGDWPPSESGWFKVSRALQIDDLLKVLLYSRDISNDAFTSLFSHIARVRKSKIPSINIFLMLFIVNKTIKAAIADGPYEVHPLPPPLLLPHCPSPIHHGIEPPPSFSSPCIYSCASFDTLILFSTGNSPMVFFVPRASFMCCTQTHPMARFRPHSIFPNG